MKINKLTKYLIASKMVTTYGEKSKIKQLKDKIKAIKKIMK